MNALATYFATVLGPYATIRSFADDQELFAASFAEARLEALEEVAIEQGAVLVDRVACRQAVAREIEALRLSDASEGL